MVGSPGESTPKVTTDGVSTDKEVGKEAVGAGQKPAAVGKKFAVIPPPGIFGQDRKAGTGGDDSSVTEIAKAIQQQTSELASLVKAQNDVTNVANGTMKRIWEDVRGACLSVESLRAV